MRRLLWLTLGFGAACLLGCFLPNWGIALRLLSLLGAAAGLAATRWWRPARIPGWLLLGVALGSLWFGLFRSWRLQPLQPYDGVTGSFTACITSQPERTQYGWTADGELLLAGRKQALRLYLHEDCCPRLGDRVQGELRLRLTAPGGSRETSFYQGKGVFLLAYQQGPLECTPGEAPLYAPRFAQRLKELLRACFPADTYPFAKALLLGATEELSYQVDTALKSSGIRHVVAVSGLHVSILFGVLSALLGKRRVLMAVVCLPALAFFAAMTGFTPSVLRACTMSALMILAQCFRREYDPPTALAFSCLVMLLANPFVILAVGFQLSVGCVAGIQLFYGPIREKLSFGGKKAPFWARGLVSGAAISLSALSLTAPLTAVYFGTVSLASVVTNVLTQWLITGLFCGLLLTCLVGLFWAGGAGALGWLLSWPIRLVLWLAEGIGRFPLSVVYTASPYIVLWLVFVYALLVVLLICKGRAAFPILCLATLGLCLSLCLSYLEPRLDRCRVTVLDVGQGQCVLLQAQGKNWLVDCGGDRDTDAANKAAALLLQQGVTRLDGLIVTHFDYDHCGGVNHLLSRVDTELLLLPAVVNDFAPVRGEVVWVDRELEITWGSAVLRLYPPIYSGDSNENSLCILLDTEECDILITGDRSGFGERMLLRSASLPQVDVLIAGHHGARDSAEAALLEAVRPATVLISVGENTYGHPHEELLARLEEFGCRVYRTDINGTIVYRR